MNPKSKSKYNARLAAAASILLLAASPLSAQDILHSNNFEDGSMGPWSASGSDAGLYENGDTPSNVSAGEASINFAPNGNFSLWKGRSGASFLVLTDPLPLATRGYTSVNVSYSYNCRNASGTRRLNLDYSPDNGTTWTLVGTFVTGSGSTTRTVTTNLTDQAKFRFTFGDSGGAAGPFFIDDIVITATPAWDGEYTDRLHWDIDGATAGAGGETPTGIWDASTTNWNAVSLGTGTAAAWTSGLAAYFAAGSDATGAYSITVDGSQDISGLVFEEGTVTLENGINGALNLVANTPVDVASALTANIGVPVTEDSTARDLIVNGTGVLNISGDLSHTGATIIAGGNLILSGENSAATGGIVNNSGLVQFESPESISGTGANVTLKPNAVMVFGSAFDAANIPSALNRVMTSSTGVIAADNYADFDFDFDTPGLTAAYLGAIGNVNYTGTFTPQGTAYRLGGAGGTLTLPSALTSGHSLAVGAGTLQLNGFDATVSALSGEALAVLENGSATTAITLTVNNAAANTFSGSLRDGDAASLSLTKGGAQNLTLTGSNDFSGDIQIGAGTLTFANLAAWGGTGKNVTVTGNSTLTSTVTGYTGGTLTVDGVTANTAGSNLTFATTTGTGSIVAASGNVTTNLGDASGFTGDIKKIAGGNGGAVQFAALSDGVGYGNLQFGGGSGDSNQRITLRYADGSAPLEFENRRIEFQPKPNNWSFRNAILENNSSVANTWVINTALLNDTDRNHEFTLSGSNAGDNEFAGLIGDSTRGSFFNGTGQLNLYKTGTGKWIVSGENTFTGRVLVNQGTLSVGDFADAGVAGALGMGGLIQLGGDERWFNGNSVFGANNSGTLEYTGGAASSDRTFEIGGRLVTNTGGGTIANNGIGALVFTAATFNDTIASITATRTVTLGGSNTDNNEIQGIIQDNVASTGRVALTKSGDGTWTLSGPNTYTGNTTVSAGSLFINGDQSTAAGNLSVSANATLGGTGTIGGNTTIAADGRLEFDISTNAASHDKLDLAATRTLTFSAASVLTITSPGGATPGTYTLATAPGGISGVAPAILNLPVDWVATVEIDGTGNDLLLIVTETGTPSSSPFDTWADGTFANGTLTDKTPTGDDDSDGLSNLLEFAFGTDPTVSDAGPLTWDGTNFTPGSPVVDVDYPIGGGVDFTARFIRRTDHGDSGSAVYAWQFSSDLADWEASDDAPAPGWFEAPTVLATDGDYQLVEAPYPLFLDNGKKARFFRVVVSLVP